MVIQEFLNQENPVHEFWFSSGSSRWGFVLFSTFFSIFFCVPVLFGSVLFKIYTASQKTGPIQLISHNFTDSQLLEVCYGNRLS